LWGRDKANSFSEAVKRPIKWTPWREMRQKGWLTWVHFPVFGTQQYNLSWEKNGPRRQIWVFRVR
jgi:hypothetical protein